MNAVFIELLRQRFPNQVLLIQEGENSFLKFPAKHHDFGDVLIHEEAPGAYIVELGQLSHAHIDVYDGTYDEISREAAEDVCDFLENLFADKIICHGSEGWGVSLSKIITMRGTEKIANFTFGLVHTNMPKILPLSFPCTK
ncbi:MAG: hypothetical protein FWG38_05140 [Defluviitaleaceae bacterium]|nr:hypothetical protein [Defluviitaleaceae bacterium]